VAPSPLLFLINSSHSRPRNYNSRAVAATATMVTLAANVAAGAITEVVAAVTPGVAPASGACLATPGLPCGSYGQLLQPVDWVHLYVAWSPGSYYSCTCATYASGLCC